MKRLCNYRHKNFLGIGAVLVCYLLLSSLLRIGSADAQQSPPTADINTEQKLDCVEQEPDCIEQELDNRINAFFTAIMEGNTESGFQEILRQSPLLVGRAGIATATIPSQIEMAKMEVGNLCSWEKFEAKRIGESVIVFRHIAKNERYPTYWMFAFYRTPSTTSSTSDSDTWVLTQVRFTSDL